MHTRKKDFETGWNAIHTLKLAVNVVGDGDLMDGMVRRDGDKKRDPIGRTSERGLVYDPRAKGRVHV